ncbi:hypothetical protein M3J09_011153 [Ascochyta lentis]
MATIFSQIQRLQQTRLHFTSLSNLLRPVHVSCKPYADSLSLPQVRNKIWFVMSPDRKRRVKITKQRLRKQVILHAPQRQQNRPQSIN